MPVRQRAGAPTSGREREREGEGGRESACAAARGGGGAASRVAPRQRRSRRGGGGSAGQARRRRRRRQPRLLPPGPPRCGSARRSQHQEQLRSSAPYRPRHLPARALGACLRLHPPSEGAGRRERGRCSSVARVTGVHEPAAAGSGRRLFRPRCAPCAAILLNVSDPPPPPTAPLLRGADRGDRLRAAGQGRAGGAGRAGGVTRPRLAFSRGGGGGVWFISLVWLGCFL